MQRPITLCSGQFGDLPVEELCRIAGGMGYDGLEVATQAHVDVERIVAEPAYREQYLDLLGRHGLRIGALSGHLAGQCVGDRWDPRLDGFVPAAVKGKPDAIRAWATQRMMAIAHAAQLLNVKVVTCFLGSPIWSYWYAFPQTTLAMVEEGFQTIKTLWTPIFDEYDRCGVQLALEVHPTEIAFDYYTTQRLLKTLDYRPTLGLNFDPSHLLWQRVDPTVFLRDFAKHVYHVHLKDVRLSRDGRAGVLGSHMTFGDTRRGWDFVSLGHGDVDFEAIIRELNGMGYDGPLCVEWEDSGMERIHGATEALAFARRLNFPPSDVAFDAALRMD
jgi:sugar phosphate isomerase/epimerase